MVTEDAISEQTIGHAASEARIEPHQMRARVDAVVEGFRAQAVSTVQGYGSDDPEDFFQWAHENKPREMKAAMHRHGMERDPRGCEPLYREYVSTIEDRDPEAILNAQFGSGITAKQVDGKVIIVFPGGKEMSFKGALKAGLISVRGASGRHLTSTYKTRNPKTAEHPADRP
ncbi:hypothetical protein QA634_32420 [Methylobacterium sp. CB376]|uniref:hypothetical protein n=1 Tax=unclassified Methylobacterium TaxID=2615210 RepID=UPI0005B9CF45|nr:MULTISPECIES: hypothetical protein [Methylobacterium]WFT79838.1 hypothetical protein QA634_32420 [Methylobacterium nodulans]